MRCRVQENMFESFIRITYPACVHSGILIVLNVFQSIVLPPAYDKLKLFAWFVANYRRSFLIVRTKGHCKLQVKSFANTSQLNLVSVRHKTTVPGPLLQHLDKYTNSTRTYDTEN